MRCCIQSLDNAMVERLNAGHGPPDEGDRVKCEFHDSWMVFRNGAFEWDREAEV